MVLLEVSFWGWVYDCGPPLTVKKVEKEIGPAGWRVVSFAAVMVLCAITSG